MVYVQEIKLYYNKNVLLNIYKIKLIILYKLNIYLKFLNYYNKKY